MLPVALLRLVGACAVTEFGITELQKQMQSGRMAPEQLDLKLFLILAVFQTFGAVVGFLVAYFVVASVARLFAERAIGKDIGAMGAWDASLRLLLRFEHQRRAQSDIRQSVFKDLCKVRLLPGARLLLPAHDTAHGSLVHPCQLSKFILTQATQLHRQLQAPIPLHVSSPYPETSRISKDQHPGSPRIEENRGRGGRAYRDPENGSMGR